MASGNDTAAGIRRRELREDDEYGKRFWTYSVIVVIASICAFSSPVLMFVKLPGAASLTLVIVAVVLFLYATFWFGSYLKLDGSQWVAAILLLLLTWVGSVIYMLTRVPVGSDEQGG